MYLEYYRKTVSLVEGQKSRMHEDQKRFGKAAFTIHAKPRMLKLNVQMFQEELKLSNALKAAKEFHRDKIKNQIAYLNSNEDSVYEIQRITNEVTNAQIEVLDAQLDVLNVEENLYKSQLLVLNKEYEDKLEMGIFVDAVEDPEELASIQLRVVEPNPKTTKLKNKLANIYRKRAAIRTKKNTILAEMKKKKEMKEAVIERNRKTTTMVCYNISVKICHEMKGSTEQWDSTFLAEFFNVTAGLRCLNFYFLKNSIYYAKLKIKSYCISSPYHGS